MYYGGKEKKKKKLDLWGKKKRLELGGDEMKGSKWDGKKERKKSVRIRKRKKKKRKGWKVANAET